MTLAEALQDHCRRLRKRGCSERTIEANQWDCSHYLFDWLPRELETIKRDECETRHTAISEGKAGEDGKQGGTYSANRCLRTFRAIWNSARKRADLPQCPTTAVEFNRESRRQEPITDLAEWYRKLTATEEKCVGRKGKGRKQPIIEKLPVVSRDRQVLMLTLLFTGCRSAEACKLEWQHVDFNKRTIHFACPKGGASRAYTVPMPDFLYRELQAHATYQSTGTKWVFPSDSESGHVEVSRQSTYRKGDNGKLVKRAYLQSAHRLRDTYCTVAAEIGIDWVISNTLVNHKLPGVHAGYVKPNVEAMRPAQEKMSREFQVRLGIITRDDAATIKIAS